MNLSISNRSSETPTQMRVKKRDGSYEPVDLNKIVTAVTRCRGGLAKVDVLRVATKTINGLYDGATTKELDELSIQTAAALSAEDPEYALLAARLLAATIEQELSLQGIESFSAAIEAGKSTGLICERLHSFVQQHCAALDGAIAPEHNERFEYFGLKTVHDRYLLRHPQERTVLESPQYFFMRVACALSHDLDSALELYGSFARLEYLPSSPTLFNAGTKHEQLSSCFLLDSPADHLEAIYKRYTDVALLSKFSGGIGLAYHRVRSRGSLIESTNGHSSGIVPWLKTLDSSVAAVNQGGKRKGACCVYLECWHADVLEFLELRDNTGDEARRTHNLNLAHWIPDLFMQRVEADGDWSLFDPKDVPHLPDLYASAFDTAYCEAEQAGLAKQVVKARALYARMMRTLAETGNGWMTFKDKCNRACNQTMRPENTVHLSNLCTEIVEVTSSEETAVCNLGSINLARHTKRLQREERQCHAAAQGDRAGHGDARSDGDGLAHGDGSEQGKSPAQGDGLAQRNSAAQRETVVIDYEKLAATVRRAVAQLDRVIDLNFYPIASTARSNDRWRPVGLGIMGLQDAFFQMDLPFDSAEARVVSRSISEHVYFHALTASVELAEQHGAHAAFNETRAAQGELQFDAWGVTPSSSLPWGALRQRILRVGLRNSLLIAIAPTATIASIAGCYECIEPQVSNLFKRETLSGDFLQINRYLVRRLQAEGLWTEETRACLKRDGGSAQGLPGLSEHHRLVYRTAWELPMRSLIDMAADRGAFIDQSQSLNLFAESPEIGRLSSMYMYAFKKGLKTTYYLRSRPATKIAHTAYDDPKARASAEKVICSLENPESCEACQ